MLPDKVSFDLRTVLYAELCRIFYCDQSAGLIAVFLHQLQTSATVFQQL